MDPTRINPIADVINKVQQHSGMVRNVQAGMGGLKHAKELTPKGQKNIRPKQPKGPGSVEQEDQVIIRPDEDMDIDDMDASERMDAASHSGVLSGLKKSEQKKRSAETSGIEYEGFNDQENSDAPGVGEKTNSKSRTITEAWDSQNLLKQKIDFIKGDVPVEAYDAAKKVVEGQIDIKNGKPADTLSQMKNVPEPQKMQMDPAESVSIMDIHDSYNKPILIEEEEEEEEGKRRREQPDKEEEEEESK